MASIVNEDADILAFNAIYLNNAMFTHSLYRQKHFLALQ
jgi:hypothetical protein